MPPFTIVTTFTPQGDQPQAIEKLSTGVLTGEKHQVLLGVTGSGKTFTMAKVVERVQKPTLVIAPNKTLAGVVGAVGFSALCFLLFRAKGPRHNAFAAMKIALLPLSYWAATAVTALSL